MTLTPAGEALLHHARVALLNIEKIAVELTEYSQGVRGHVRMLANLSAIVQFLPEDLSGFFSAHEFLRVDLQERPSGQVVRGIEEGAAEIGICSGEAETRAWKPSIIATTIWSWWCGRIIRSRRATGILFADTLDFDHIGLHAASSIYLRSQYAATQAGKRCGCASRCRGSTRYAAWCKPIWGSASIPDRAFEVIGAGMGLRAIRLCDEWAQRELKIVVRDAGHLSGTGRLVLEHLRAAGEGKETAWIRRGASR